MALAQAKDIAHMQMEVIVTHFPKSPMPSTVSRPTHHLLLIFILHFQMERQKQKQSPITNMIRTAVEKVGYNLSFDKRRLSRQILTDMNLAQLQIIVNDFHSQIESLNEQLVKHLMDRDDLHMGQDAMLVDIEDLTRYL